jgi:hypothetical protein
MVISYRMIVYSMFEPARQATSAVSPVVQTV